MPLVVPSLGVPKLLKRWRGFTGKLTQVTAGSSWWKQRRSACAAPPVQVLSGELFSSEWFSPVHDLYFSVFRAAFDISMAPDNYSKLVGLSEDKD